jgi:hypothetical protein
MSCLPFLIAFAEPVQTLPRPSLAYDPVARRNRLRDDAGPFAAAVLAAGGTVLTETREQKDHSEQGSVDHEGTTVTMTSESKDHVEDDRILDLTAQSAVVVLDGFLGTKKTDSREQSDADDGDQGVQAAAPSDLFLSVLGTVKTGHGEQSDPTS